MVNCHRHLILFNISSSCSLSFTHTIRYVIVVACFCISKPTVHRCYGATYRCTKDSFTRFLPLFLPRPLWRVCSTESCWQKKKFFTNPYWHELPPHFCWGTIFVRLLSGSVMNAVWLVLVAESQPAVLVQQPQWLDHFRMSCKAYLQETLHWLICKVNISENTTVKWKGAQLLGIFRQWHKKELLPK